MANLYLIPVQVDYWDYEYTASLDDVVYTLRFRWNSRMNRWLLDVMEENRNPIVMGVVLNRNVDLLYRYKDTRLPPGTLFVWDTTDSGLEADNVNFGTKVLLAYQAVLL